MARATTAINRKTHYYRTMIIKFLNNFSSHYIIGSGRHNLLDLYKSHRMDEYLISAINLFIFVNLRICFFLKLKVIESIYNKKN